MATKNFTQFNTATPLTTSDFIVGYNAAGTAEIKTQVKDILNLASDQDHQTLLFNDINKQLSISSGNTVSLASLVDSGIDSGVRALTGTWQDTSTIVQTNSASWAIDSTTDTGVRALTGNWQSTYTTFQSNSSYYVSSNSALETPTTGISAISNIVFLTQATYNALNVKLPTTMYVIVSA